MFLLFCLEYKLLTEVLESSVSLASFSAGNPAREMISTTVVKNHVAEVTSERNVNKQEE